MCKKKSQKEKQATILKIIILKKIVKDKKTENKNKKRQIVSWIGVI